MRLAAAAFGGGDPGQRQIELLLEHEVMREPRLIVGRERDHQRALAAQLHIDAGGLAQLGGESRPACLAVAAERDQRFFAGLRLGAGREHSGGRMGRARTRGAAVEHRHLPAARRQPPGDAEADDAGADDDDVRAPCRLRRDVRRQAIRQAAAPFAGMTQTELPPASNYNGLRCQSTLSALFGSIEPFGPLSKWRHALSGIGIYRSTRPGCVS